VNVIVPLHAPEKPVDDATGTSNFQYESSVDAVVVTVDFASGTPNDALADSS